MLHLGTRDISRRRRVRLTVLRGAAWNRAAAEMRARLASAAALEGAAAEVRHGARDDRVRALVDRALRRLSLVTRRPVYVPSLGCHRSVPVARRADADRG